MFACGNVHNLISNESESHSQFRMSTFRSHRKDDFRLGAMLTAAVANARAQALAATHWTPV